MPLDSGFVRIGDDMVLRDESIVAVHEERTGVTRIFLATTTEPVSVPIKEVLVAFACHAGTRGGRLVSFPVSCAGVTTRCYLNPSAVISVREFFDDEDDTVFSVIKTTSGESFVVEGMGVDVVLQRLAACPALCVVDEDDLQREGM
jgi:hypothetical protein